MNEEAIYKLLSAISTVCAIVFGYIAFSRGKKQDVTTNAKEEALVLSEIGYIKSNTDEIKREQKEQRHTNIELITRLTSVEASAKQAHKRIDSLENHRSREE